MPLSDDDIEKLFAQLGGRLLLGCLQITGNQGDADDALAETFLRVCNKRDQLDRGKNVEGWIYRTACRVCIDILRKRRGYQQFPPDDEGVFEIRDTGLNQEQEAIHAQFLAAINQLEPDDRKILLTWLDGKTLDELSRELDWPLSKVKTILERAKRRLIRALNKNK